MKSRRGNGSTFKRGDVYWIKYYRNGTAYRESFRSNKEADARGLLKKRMVEICLGRFIGPDAARVTKRDLAEDLLNDYKVNGKRSLEGLEFRLKHVLPFFGHYKAHEVGTDRVKNI